MKRVTTNVSTRHPCVAHRSVLPCTKLEHLRTHYQQNQYGDLSLKRCTGLVSYGQFVQGASRYPLVDGGGEAQGKGALKNTLCMCDHFVLDHDGSFLSHCC